MKYRFYEEGDEAGIVELMKTCFDTYRNFQLTVEKWLGFEVDYAFKRSLALVAEDNGKIVGHVQLVLRELEFGDARVKVGGIANVSTLPEYRGRGIASTLVKMAIDYCRGNGIAMTSLYTGYPGTPHRVYWRAGYADTEFEYNFVIDGIRVEDKPGVPLETREAGPGDLRELASMYERFSPPGRAWRPDDYWLKKILGSNMYTHTFFYWSRDSFHRLMFLYQGRTVGYVLAAKPGVRAEGWPLPSDLGAILEANGDPRFLGDIYLEAMRILAGEGAKSIAIMAPLTHYRYLGEAAYRSCGGIYMACITDLEALLTQMLSELQRRVESGDVGGRMNIMLSSEYGRAGLTVRGPEVSIGCDRPDAEVWMDRDCITRLFHCLATFSDVVYSGNVKVKSDVPLRDLINVMDALFPYRSSYVWAVDHW